MKQTSLICVLAVLAGTFMAAAADSKSEVQEASKKLANASGYSWKAVTDYGGAAGGGNRMRPGPTEGKTVKDGVVCLKMIRGENSFEAVLKGDKGAIKGQEGWQSLAELTQSDAAGGGGGAQRVPGRFMARNMQNFKTPAVEAGELVAKVKELNKDGDALTGNLTEDGAKSLMTMGRPGGNAPEISDAKGSAKFWIKEGNLVKYEFKVQGKISFNNNEMEIDRTTTVEIKDIGSTKVEVPAEASAKLK